MRLIHDTSKRCLPTVVLHVFPFIQCIVCWWSLIISLLLFLHCSRAMSANSKFTNHKQNETTSHHTITKFNKFITTNKYHLNYNAVYYITGAETILRVEPMRPLVLLSQTLRENLRQTWTKNPRCDYGNNFPGSISCCSYFFGVKHHAICSSSIASSGENNFWNSSSSVNVWVLESNSWNSFSLKFSLLALVKCCENSSYFFLWEKHSLNVSGLLGRYSESLTCSGSCGQGSRRLLGRYSGSPTCSSAGAQGSMTSNHKSKNDVS